jgi:hypothetical protein
MPTAVNGQLYYSPGEVQAGLPQYHDALRMATGYTGQFSADPTQKFQQYISGATPEQRDAYNALSNIYSSGYDVTATPEPISAPIDRLPVPAQQAIDLSPIQTGITGLETGQQGLMTGQQGLMTGITGLGTGQQDLMTGQQALGAGQGAIQGVIGAPGEGQPTTLFAGQAGLMGGQQALGQQLTGGIQDITGAVGGVSQNIEALERAAEQYQREAQRQRAQIQTSGMTDREQIARQVAEVGQQVNTGVEQQRSLMGGMAAPVAAMGATAGIQPGGATQAATQYAQTQKFAPPAQGQQTIMGPMGPMTVDPRDQVTRPVSSSGLMNYPV